MSTKLRPTNVSYEQEIEYSILLNLTSRRRWSRVSMYTLLLGSSISSLLFPSQILISNSSPTFSLVWSILFILSALGALLSSITGRWELEWASLPLLISSFLVFAIVLFFNASGTNGFVSVPYSFLFGAFGSGLFSRWLDLQILYKRYRKISKEQ